MRLLYDRDYIESNCTLPYDELTKLDTTPGTYWTNHVIGSIGLVVAFALLLHMRCRQGTENNSNHDDDGAALYSKLIVAYFVLLALGYSIAGVGHETVDSLEDNTAKIYGVVAASVMVLPMWALQLAVVVVYKEEKGRAKYLLFVACHLFNLVVLVLTLSLQSQTPSGIYLIVVYLTFFTQCKPVS
jgi:hypothetical protein